MAVGLGGEARAEAATAAAEELVARVTPDFAERVSFELRPEQETPTIEPASKGDAQGIRICAANVAECARAYGYYLRSVACVHLSWNGDLVNAEQFVVPEEPVKVPPTLPFNYAFNYCAMSYTAAHWSRDRWLQEIDRLALNGFRYVLVTAGLEKVWQGFLADTGCGNKAAEYIANPCYSAWWNMGNLEGTGGPVSQKLIDSEAELGRLLVQRITQLGMQPVLQAYVGFYPSAAPHDGDIVKQGKWVSGYVRPSILRADTQRFKQAAQSWYKRLEAVYGYRARAFAGDLFHEGGITKGLPLAKIAGGVQQAMQAYSPGSLWFLQAWAGNPRKELLNGLSREHTIILALQKDLSPGVDITRNYGGLRYVWCELANFGGKQGLYGGMDVLENMQADAGGASGFGLLSEGLETNPLYYELFFERINNREHIDRQSFLTRYTQARYGLKDYRLVLASQLLSHSVYTPDAEREGGLENILCAHPRLDADKVTTWSNPTPYYSPKDVLLAGRLMLQTAREHPELMQHTTFRYDLVDVCRQVLADQAREILPRCKESYDHVDPVAFRRESEAFCELITRTADLLAAHEEFLLGTYLQGAKEREPEGSAEMTKNLRRLITTWSTAPGSLNDYAHRQFSEMFRYYYLPRWKAFFETLANGENIGTLREEINTNNGEKTIYRSIENKRIDAIERSFPGAEIPLLTEPQGNLLKLAEQALR